MYIGGINNMIWIILIAQLILMSLLYLFVRYNYSKIDIWLMVLVSGLSLIPIIGGIIILDVWTIILYSMSNEYELSDTKLNRFLFRNKFK